jgi:hypothetical protein
LYPSLKLNSNKYSINKKKYKNDNDDDIIKKFNKYVQTKENVKNILSIEKFTFIFKQPIKKKDEKVKNNNSV